MHHTVPTEDPDNREKIFLTKYQRISQNCSISDKVVFIITLCFVILATAATFCIVYFFVPITEAIRGKKNCNNKLEYLNISGVYHLESHDSQYRDYLLAMDIPTQAVNHILTASETIIMRTGVGEQNSIEMTTITDWVTRRIQFQLETDFRIHYGKGAGKGVLHNFCSMPAYNIIRCSSDEREKGWSFQFDLVFSPTGLLNKRFFITKNIRMKKFYRKE